MARVYVISEEEMLSLFDQLKLTSLKDNNHFRSTDFDKPASIDDVHRTFHYVVVRWAQAMGFNTVR